MSSSVEGYSKSLHEKVLAYRGAVRGQPPLKTLLCIIFVLVGSKTQVRSQH